MAPDWSVTIAPSSRMPPPAPPPAASLPWLAPALPFMVIVPPITICSASIQIAAPPSPPGPPSSPSAEPAAPPAEPMAIALVVALPYAAPPSPSCVELLSRTP